MYQPAKLWVWKIRDTLAQPGRIVNEKGRPSAPWYYVSIAFMTCGVD